MVYTVGKAVQHARTLCSEAGSNYFSSVAKIAVEDALAEFFSRDWPFLAGEGVIATTTAYNTGTISFTQGLTTAVGTGTAWLTTWPVPAVIRADGANLDRLLVNAFVSGTQLTLDTPWPYPSIANATYTLEFPAYSFPNYVNIDGVMSSYGFYRMVGPMPYTELMQARVGWVVNSYPQWYCIVPGDGVSSTTKIWLSPSPNNIYSVRYHYKAAVPAFSIWDYGNVTVANGAVPVTGTGTNFDKTGLALAGNIFEINDPAPANQQPYISGVVASAGITATNVNLVSNWTGRTVAIPSGYSISPQISIPDDAIPAFRMLVDSYVYARLKPDLAPNRRQMYLSAMNDLATRYERSIESSRSRGVFGYDKNSGYDGPGFPTELTVKVI